MYTMYSIPQNRIIDFTKNLDLRDRLSGLLDRPGPPY
jgi:hypothetical protein